MPGDISNLPLDITVDIKDSYQGDTYPGNRFNVTRNGVPKDLTGASITMTFLKNNKRGVDDHTLTLGTGLTVFDAANEIFDMDEIPVLDWNSGDYHADCEIIYADGEVKTPFKYIWRIKADITNNS
jgi:hypothetical protein